MACASYRRCSLGCSTIAEPKSARTTSHLRGCNSSDASQKTKRLLSFTSTRRAISLYETQGLAGRRRGSLRRLRFKSKKAPSSVGDSFSYLAAQVQKGAAREELREDELGLKLREATRPDF